MPGARGSHLPHGLYSGGLPKAHEAAVDFFHGGGSHPRRFQNLRPGSDYDGLHQAALCRSKADWLVGINATRLFSVLYHRTLNVGRVLSPTLALIVQREAEIAAFQPEPFYTVVLGLSDFTASGERMKDKTEAQALQEACLAAGSATVQSVERKEKIRKAACPL